MALQRHAAAAAHSAAPADAAAKVSGATAAACPLAVLEENEEADVLYCASLSNQLGPLLEGESPAARVSCCSFDGVPVVQGAVCLGKFFPSGAWATGAGDEGVWRTGRGPHTLMMHGACVHEYIIQACM